MISREEYEELLELQRIYDNPYADLTTPDVEEVDRTWGEVFTDTGTSALQSAVGLAEAGYGILDLISGGNLDETFDLSGNFEETQQFLQETKSDKIQQLAQEAAQQEGVWDTAVAYLSNPTLIADEGVKSAFSFLPAGVALKGGQALSKVVPKLRDAVRRSPKVQSAVEKGSVATGVTLQMTGTTYNSVSAEVEKGLIAEGYSKEEAKDLGKKAGREAAALVAPIAAVTSYYGSALERSLFGGKGFKGAIPGAAKGAVTEGLEEMPQAGVEQMASNIARGEYLGEVVSPFERVPEAMTMGGIIGAASGGVLGGPAGYANKRQIEKLEAEAEVQREADARRREEAYNEFADVQNLNEQYLAEDAVMADLDSQNAQVASNLADSMRRAKETNRRRDAEAAAAQPLVTTEQPTTDIEVAPREVEGELMDRPITPTPAELEVDPLTAEYEYLGTQRTLTGPVDQKAITPPRGKPGSTRTRPSVTQKKPEKKVEKTATEAARDFKKRDKTTPKKPKTTTPEEVAKQEEIKTKVKETISKEQRKVNAALKKAENARKKAEKTKKPEDIEKARELQDDFEIKAAEAKQAALIAEERLKMPRAERATIENQEWLDKRGIVLDEGYVRINDSNVPGLFAVVDYDLANGEVVVKSYSEKDGFGIEEVVPLRLLRKAERAKSAEQQQKEEEEEAKFQEILLEQQQQPNIESARKPGVFEEEQKTPEQLEQESLDAMVKEDVAQAEKELEDADIAEKRAKAEKKKEQKRQADKETQRIREELAAIAEADEELDIVRAPDREEELTPEENRDLQFDALEDLLEEGEITQEVYQKRLEEIESEYLEAYIDKKVEEGKSKKKKTGKTGAKKKPKKKKPVKETLTLEQLQKMDYEVQEAIVDGDHKQYTVTDETANAWFKQDEGDADTAPTRVGNRQEEQLSGFKNVFEGDEDYDKFFGYIQESNYKLLQDAQDLKEEFPELSYEEAFRSAVADYLADRQLEIDNATETKAVHGAFRTTGKDSRQAFVDNNVEEGIVKTPNAEKFTQGSVEEGLIWHHTNIPSDSRPDVREEGTGFHNFVGEGGTPFAHFGSKQVGYDLYDGAAYDNTTIYHYPLWINIKKPLWIRDYGSGDTSISISNTDVEGLTKLSVNAGAIDREDAAKIKTWKDLQKAMTAAGYDGWAYNNRAEDVNSTSYITLRQNQVKSAVDNINYNPRKLGIRQNIEGATAAPETERQASRQLSSLLRKGMTPSQVMEWLMMNSTFADYRGIAARLLPQIEQLGDTLTIQLYEDMVASDNVRSYMQGANGVYVPFGMRLDQTTDEIYIDDLADNFTEVVLHEMIHAVTYKKIQKVQDGEGTQAEKEAVNELINEFDYIIEELAAGDIEKLSIRTFDLLNKGILRDPHEMLTYALTDKDFQNDLRNIKSRRNENKSLWTQFRSVIAKLLGLEDNSVLGDILDVSEKIFNLDLKVRSQHEVNKLTATNRIVDYVRDTWPDSDISRLFDSELELMDTAASYYLDGVPIDEAINRAYDERLEASENWIVTHAETEAVNEFVNDQRDDTNLQKAFENPLLIENAIRLMEDGTPLQDAVYTTYFDFVVGNPFSKYLVTSVKKQIASDVAGTAEPTVTGRATEKGHAAPWTSWDGTKARGDLAWDNVKQKGYQWLLQHSLIKRLARAGVTALNGLKEVTDRIRGEALIEIERANEEVLKPVTKFKKEKPEEYKKVVNMMMKATVDNIDYKRKGEFQRLSSEAQEVYRRVEDFYRKQGNDYVNALEQQLTDLDVTDETKAEYQKYIDTIRNKISNKIYFPLQRYGKWRVDAISPDGSRYTSFNENKIEVDREMAELHRKGYTNVKFGSVKDVLVQSDYSRDIDTTIINKAAQFIDDMGGNQDAKNALYQTLMHVTPSKGITDRMIRRRKNISGYDDTDIERGLASALNQYYDISRRKYSGQKSTMFKDAQAEVNAISNVKEKIRAQELLDEAKLREDMSGQERAWLSRELTKANFLLNLGFNTSTALVNLTQNAIVGIPVLTSQYGAGAIPELTKGMTDAIKVLSGTRLRGNELAMYNELTKLGAITETQSAMITELSRGKAGALASKYEKGVEWSAWMFHKAEMVNRLSVALTAYRLATKEGKDHDTAVKEAAQAVDDIHFDYSEEGKSRMQRGDIGNVILAFKTYPMYMISYLSNNFVDMYKGESTEVKKQAAGRFFGTLSMTGMFAGAMGMPLASVVFLVADALQALFGEEDEWDAHQAFNEWADETFGEENSDIIKKGFVSWITGADISSRTSLSDMFYRIPQGGGEPADWANSLIEAGIGPIGSRIESIPRGAELMFDGKVFQGIEAFAPTFYSNFSKASRMAYEGAAYDNYDRLMIEDADALDVFKRGIGFTPLEYSKTSSEYWAKQRVEREAKDDKRKLLRDLSLATINRDRGAKREARQAIREFNKGRPRDERITSRTIDRAIKEMKRKRTGEYLND